MDEHGSERGQPDAATAEPSMDNLPDVTTILQQSTGGSRAATNRLLGLLYDELRGVADRLLAHERPDHTLQATELVHEAYARLVDQTRCRWENRAHFLALASQA